MYHTATAKHVQHWLETTLAGGTSKGRTRERVRKNYCQGDGSPPGGGGIARGREISKEGGVISPASPVEAASQHKKRGRGEGVNEIAGGHPHVWKTAVGVALRRIRGPHVRFSRTPCACLLCSTADRFPFLCVPAPGVCSSPPEGPQPHMDIGSRTMYSLHLGTRSFTRVRCVLKKDTTGQDLGVDCQHSEQVSPMLQQAHVRAGHCLRHNGGRSQTWNASQCSKSANQGHC